MKKLLFTSVLTCLTILAIAQSDLKEYDWKKAPVERVSLTESEQAEHSLFVQYVNKVHYYFNDQGNFTQRNTRHYTIRVNTAKGIEDNNRVYIPVTNAKVVTAKARVIKKDGTAIELKESAMKEAEDIESMGAFKYFAVEGLEEGYDIEVLYTLDKSPSINGVREMVQFGKLLKQYDFELTSPSNLVWGFKSYNGLPDIQKDTTVEDQNRYFLSVSNLTSIPSEKYSFEDISRKYFVFRLESNTANGVSNITSYLDVSNNIFRNISQIELSKNALKKYNAIIKELNIGSADPLQKIRKFEAYIKHNFQITEDEQAMLFSPDFLLENKVGHGNAFLKLFTYFLDQENINYEIVCTSDRSEYLFDPDFDAYYVLNEYMFYIPDLDAYIAPGVFSSRVGLPPANWTSTHGLFVRKMKLGSIVKGAGKIGFIPPKSMEDTKDFLKVDLTIPDDFSAVQSNIRREMSGYYAEIYQPYYELIPADKRKPFMEELVRIGGQDDKLVSYKVTNAEPESIIAKPFIIEAEVTSENLLQKAGNKFILKIGNVIGEQAEMYQEKERVLQVELPFKHILYREISLTIPDGYKVKNPEALQFNVVHQHEGVDVMGFVTNVVVEGQVLKVTINEYYNVITLPVERYKPFEEVINAAADFYEASIQLEKL